MAQFDLYSYNAAQSGQICNAQSIPFILNSISHYKTKLWSFCVSATLSVSALFCTRKISGLCWEIEADSKDLMNKSTDFPAFRSHIYPSAFFCFFGPGRSLHFSISFVVQT